MLLIAGIDLLVVVTLAYLIATRGLEASLPYFAFIVTLLPEECRIPIPGLFDLYTRRLALAILLIAYLAYPKRSAPNKIPLRALLVLHSLWIAISTATSIVFLTSVKQMTAQVLEYYAIYWIVFKTVSEVRTVKKIALAMVGAVAVACVFGLSEAYAEWSVLSIFPEELQLTYGASSAVYAELMDRGIRARSVFTHPILFGGAISMMIPITLYFFTTVKSAVQKNLLFLALLLLFWNLFKTSSRGPWLATALSMAVLFLAASGRIRKIILAMAVLAVVVLIARPGVGQTIWNMYLATMDPSSAMGASYAYRPVLLQTVLDSLNSDPFRAVFGFGLGSFRDQGLILVLPGIETHRWYTCDSAWILFMYETGYVGVALAGALLLKPAYSALRSARKLPRPDRHFSLICFSCMLSFYFVMLSVASYGWGQNGHMLWLLIGISLAYQRVVGLQRVETQQMASSLQTYEEHPFALPAE